MEWKKPRAHHFRVDAAAGCLSPGNRARQETVGDCRYCKHSFSITTTRVPGITIPQVLNTSLIDRGPYMLSCLMLFLRSHYMHGHKKSREVCILKIPLLCPSSKYLKQAVLEAAKHESRGLKVVWNSLAERFDKVAAETALYDAYPKWVVKTYLTLCVGKPFTWALLGHLLQVSW